MFFSVWASLALNVGARNCCMSGNVELSTVTIAIRCWVSAGLSAARTKTPLSQNVLDYRRIPSMFEVLVQSLKLVGLRKLFETLYGCSDRRNFGLMMWPSTNISS